MIIGGGVSLPPPGARFSGVEENLFFERFRPRPVQGLNSTFQLAILFENELPKLKINTQVPLLSSDDLYRSVLI